MDIHSPFGATNRVSPASRENAAYPSWMVDFMIKIWMIWMITGGSPILQDGAPVRLRSVGL